MPYCEDYPCCGHEPGQCPTQNADGSLTYHCLCGAPLKPGASSSLCPGCLRRGDDDERYSYDEDRESYDPETNLYGDGADRHDNF